MMISKFVRHAVRESGLGSVYSTGLDAWLIIFCRSSRMFAYGAVSLILALFFAELRVPDSHIGLFMTLTLAGDVVLSLLLTLIADHIGRRRTLAIGALLMVASGATFAVFENYWVLLVAAVVGVISATGGDFGPFRAVEESVLSELTSPATRSDVLAWYVTTASLGSAVGTEMAGRTVEWLRSRPGWTLLDAYHACFWVYVAMGGVNLLANTLLSPKCELGGARSGAVPAPVPPAAQGEAAPLLQDTAAEAGDAVPQTSPVKSGPPTKSRFSQISRETRSIISALWLLLMIDSLADGMVSMSLTTYYLAQKFPSLPKSTLGDVVSTAHLLSSLSSVFAGPLARHIGLVNTMVFTHIPSSAAVLLFPFPKTTVPTFALLMIRVGLNNMDQAPRSALIAAVVKPEERTAVMGITGLLRTLAATVGPSITGVLSGKAVFWIAFVVAGALRLAYDFGVFALFINIRLHRHEPDASTERRAAADEEVPAEERVSAS